MEEIYDHKCIALLRFIAFKTIEGVGRLVNVWHDLKIYFSFFNLFTNFVGSGLESIYLGNLLMNPPFVFKVLNDYYFFFR